MPPQSPNRKQRLCCDNGDRDVPTPMKFKANNAHRRIAIIIPIMIKQLRHNITSYGRYLHVHCVQVTAWTVESLNFESLIAICISR